MTTPRTTGPRYIADDFGLCPSGDEAILELLDLRKLHGTSVLVTHAPPDAVAALAQRRSCSLGLHLNLTEGHPPDTDALASLLRSDGTLPGLETLTARILSGRIALHTLEHAIAAQWERLLSLAGRVDHVDGHQHIQYLPPVLAAVRRVAARRGQPDIPIRLAPLHTPRPGLRSLLLAPLAAAGRLRLLGTAHPTPRRVIDYDARHRVPPRQQDEVMLHLAHPDVPGPPDHGSYPRESRIAQFEARRRERP